MDIGNYVRTNRKRLGIRQEDLAKRLGVARTTIVGIEHGTRKLKVSELAILKDLGFPDESLQLDIVEASKHDQRWMFLNETERVLVRAFRSGRIERVLRMCLAHKDEQLAAMNMENEDDE
jgi:transcriptional regulator with XRE-family HTH domain